MSRPGSGRVALVTGASAGIGRAFADVLAREGFDLVLTARRVERLEALARELAGRHEISAHPIPADLAQVDAPARLVEAIVARGLQVDVLINNAGYGVPGSYARTTWRQQDDALRVMVTAPAELAHRLLPGMIERRWGRIVNVSSLAALLPGVAGHTLYAASKAFLVRFSESLSLEVASHGVHVTALCPGFTYTEFHDVTGTRAQVSTFPRFMWLDAQTVAERGYEAVTRGTPVVVVGRANALMVLLARILPQGIVWGLMRRNSRKFRRT